MTPPYGGVFVARGTVLDADGVGRALTRISHEIVERNNGLEEVALVALQTGGVRVGMAITRHLFEIDGIDVPFGTLDVTMHRDDIGLRPVVAEAATKIDFDINGAKVVLVDDVLFTGRTIRAALDALNDFGRPREVQLAVVIDRGHRELPIRPDYVGKNLPTARDEVVDVNLEGVLLGEMRK
ncbi:MAG TPA: bifunctional pyr operon transcriptional regulator/uracil phosphoribosyltransferase PyrR [Acidimicrobiaceae bacterium]|nr:bifunctional pyr operon transcriptional regulator/uracil phosphoribosyltransferase PyrR [Acidimicrobiaceae bacterium]HCB36836.1 bifunctional pyr operon transcriptional regulator/uracil phosphoribosyltransferase PyrR [Acidimicrobiaceae bacterium]